MRAAVIDRFGGPEVLRVIEVPRPVLAPGELLVRVYAAGTNPIDAVHPLDEIAAVHARLDSGHGQGKVVIAMPILD